MTTITRERFNRIIPAICETAQFMVQDIIIKVLKFLICFILVTIGMIIMITGKGEMIVTGLNILYITININYFTN